MDTKLKKPCHCGSTENPHTCFGFEPATPLPKEDEEIVEEFMSAELDLTNFKSVSNGLQRITTINGVSVEDWLKSILTLKNKQIEEAYKKGVMDENTRCLQALNPKN